MYNTGGNYKQIKHIDTQTSTKRKRFQDIIIKHPQDIISGGKTATLKISNANT